MKYAIRTTLILSSLCFFAPITAAQTTASTVLPQPYASLSTQPITCSATLGPIVGTVLVGPPAPYSAVRQFSNVQTLADGTRISPKLTSEKIFRDSQNRTRTERPLCSGAADDPAAMAITIRDPVSAYEYILDSQNHIAHRYLMKVSRNLTSAKERQRSAMDGMDKILESMPDANGLISITETLSSQIMEGVYVEGKRTTETIPAGLEDNEEPITLIEEEWYSPDLDVPILTKDFDSRHGEMTTRLTNIDRSEPRLSLFQPPPDYKIVDENIR